ncbi:MAG: TIR domain-containing protein [Aestuariivita sp.]|nr:TIR domain-containing protein [Aestuariivita sp.]
MHKVFISYHHQNDQQYKEALIELGEEFSVFIDRSVNTNDISEEYEDDVIRRIIRDNYLVDSTVTIVLVGKETKRRKHVDWEIFSSMYNGSVNKRSGVIVVNLPGTSENIHASYGDKEQLLYPDVQSWTPIESRAEYERIYPDMPARIIDNLIEPNVKISVIPWGQITRKRLAFLINAAFNNRANCEYKLTPMRRANS